MPGLVDELSVPDGRPDWGFPLRSYGRRRPGEPTAVATSINPGMAVFRIVPTPKRSCVFQAYNGSDFADCETTPMARIDKAGRAAYLIYKYLARIESDALLGKHAALDETI